MLPGSLTCDIFCRVVDNFGDIGVTWRLARQLNREHGLSVRLIVDDLASFKKLAPTIDTASREQIIDGVTVVEWRDPLELLAPATLIIEAFGCELPAAYVSAMALKPVAPVWINLEYLSAEAWVESHHLLPSPHPTYALTKYFFFPGFTAKTGGLIRENELQVSRDVATRPDANSTLSVFVFAYENCPIEALVLAIGKMRPTVRCYVSEGAVSDKLKHWCASQAKNASKAAPMLEFDVVPFVPQAAFDDLLRMHDILFVRGEDSLVRAVWAAKPFVWHIYPQADDAHWVKLNAFLDVYCQGLSGTANVALRELWRAWNADDDAAIEAAWAGFNAQLPELERHAKDWSNHQAEQPDLGSNLLSFYKKTAKI